jgi:DNA-binding ferritin-like protein (Dps family)
MSTQPLTEEQKQKIQKAYKRFEERLKKAEEKFHSRLKEIKKDAFQKIEAISNAKEEKQIDELLGSLDEA